MRVARNLSRLAEVGRVAVRHGWGPLLVRAGLGDVFKIKEKTEERTSGQVELREALEELGPTYVKFGQLLSTRPDLIPDEYLVELAKLQDTAPTIPYEEVREVIHAELGADPDEIYRKFDHEPLAAASLGQVHTAVLYDGTEVIVKIQRPGIKKLIDTDIDILFSLSRMLEQVSERARTYALTELVEEFALIIHEELDYAREGRNTEKLRANMADVPGVVVPAVHWELTTSKVLTIDRLHGIKITDLDNLLSTGHDLKAISNRLTAAFLEQIFVDGFFHADPHPGNIMVMDGSNIGLVDVGQVGRFDADTKAGALRLLIAFQHENTRQFAEEVVNLGVSQGDVSISQLTQDLQKILRGYYDMPSRNVNLGLIIARTLDTSARHRVRLPTSFALLGKVLANIDGINRLLDPEFNFTEAAKPYVTRAARSEFDRDTLITDFYRAAMDLREFVFGLPEHLNNLMRKMVEGSLRVEFKHVGLQDLTARLDKIGTRISSSLIVAAIIIGSSMLVQAGKGPKGWYGFPTIGIIGYIIALIFGVYLLISMIRSEKTR